MSNMQSMIDNALASAAWMAVAQMRLGAMVWGMIL